MVAAAIAAATAFFYGRADSTGITANQNQTDTQLTMPDFCKLIPQYGRLTVADLALLSLIDSGVDHRADLVNASGMQWRTLYRRIDALHCKARWVNGKVAGSRQYPPLVQWRKHPHAQGLQYVLTKEGRKLLKSFVA